MSELDPVYVLDAMRRLQKTQPEVFGKQGHNFLLNPTLDEAAVADFEARHSIRLPEDYRNFITKIGNGGAGPYYGLLRLGELDLGFDMCAWAEGDGNVGILSEPFPYTETWNPEPKYPPEELRLTDEAEYSRLFEEYRDEYWDGSLMNGSFPICHEGCGIRIWLVVTGPEAGHLWEDDRANDGGIRPVLLSDGSRATFSAWYREWLEKGLAAPPRPSIIRRFCRSLIGR